MKVKQIVICLVLASFSAEVMSKKVAGLIVYRQINDNIDYLVLKPRSNKKDWSPPKGRLDKGEDYFTAAVRETQEESGYTVDDLDIDREQSLPSDALTRSGKKKTSVYWLAKLKNLQKQPELSDEHVDFRWVSKDEAIELCKIPELSVILNQFDQIIRTP